MGGFLYVVLGGSSALGQLTVNKLAEAGEKVVSSYNKSVMDNLLPSVKQIQCDVTSYDSCLAFAKHCGGISENVFLVYFPGISANSMTHKLHPDQWKRVLDVNLAGAFHITRAFLPSMRRVGNGRIVYAGSVAGRLGIAGTSAYSASKEGLRGFMRVVASENAGKGITANLIEIGYMNAGLTSTIPEDAMKSILDSIPARSLGDPLQIQSVLSMLEECTYMTGSTITLSGGL